MQIFKKGINFYILSNIHVAIAGFCLTKITLLKFEIFENLIPVFVALSIVISYNFIRFYELKTNKLGSLKPWFSNHLKSLFILSGISGVGLFYILFFTNFNLASLFVLLPFGFMTLFYVVPLFKIKKFEVSFRNFPGIKIFSIAFSWAAVSVIFPLIEAEIELTKVIFIIFLQQFLILIAIILPFDIRDVNIDPKNLKTLPQVLGVTASKIIGILLLLFFVGLTFLIQNSFNNEFLINLSIAITTGLFLWFSSPKKSRYYAGFWVEAIPIFWLLLIVLFL